MEKETFLNMSEPWWLLQRDGDARIVQGREQLGENFSWGSQWQEEPNRVEELFQYLEVNQSRLLTELDLATDVEKQVVWLQDLTDATAKPQTAPEPQNEVQPQSGAEPQSSAQTSNEAPDGTAASAGAAAAAAPEGVGGEPPAQPAPNEAASGAPAAVPATWDATWGMFLRFVDGSYEYALSTVLADEPGTDSPAGEADGVWHKTPEAAGQARKQVADLKETYADFVANPEIPISQEELDQALKDPNYQQMMAAAQAELEAELAAADEEG